MATKILYGDKSQGTVSTFPTNQRWNFGDANEVKTVVNSHADDIDAIDLDITQINLDIAGKQDIISNIVVVNTLADLPTPSSGVITLNVPNTIYRFVGAVSIGANSLDIAAVGVKLCGLFSTVDQIISTTTSAVVTSTNFSVTIQQLSIIGATSTYIIDMIGTGAENVSIDRCVFPSSVDIIRVDNVLVLFIDTCILATFTNGILVQNTCTNLLIKDCLIIGFTGTAIDLNGCTGYAMSIAENSATLQGGSTFLNVAASGANVLSGGQGTIAGNKTNINAGGTPISGYDTFEIEWGVTLNDQIKDSDRFVPSGWAFYDDAQTTPVTQTFNTTFSKLQIDGGGATSESGYLPNSIRGTGELWDTTNDLITPITIGDAYDLRVTLGVTSKTGSPNSIIMNLDIGGGVSPTIVIAEEDKAVTKAPPFSVIFTFPYFTLSSFLANGGQIFLATDTGSVTVQNRDILVTRTSSGAA